MATTCPVVSPEIQNLFEKITKAYPEASQRAELTPDMCANWVGKYNEINNKPIDFVPEMTPLLNFIEKSRNKEGKSFFYTPYTVTYNLPGQKQQTYTIIHDKIFNKDGKEVFPKDVESMKTHRLRIFANLAVMQGRAVQVTHKGNKYIVNDRNQIISGKNGHIMQWGEENGDRREILRLAQIAFREKQKAESPTISPIATPNQNDVLITQQLIDHLKAQRINVHNRAEMIQYLKEHGSAAIQEAIKEQQEMADIKTKAIADGTFMKAPNGNPTNLTERQWLQVRTKTFKNWFGDWMNDPANASKVVDENGEPLVVWHNGTETYTFFDLKKSPNGFYFGTQEQAFAVGDMDEDYHPNGMLIQCFLNIKNPKITTFDDRDINKYNSKYDGFIIEVSKEDAKELASIGNYNPENFRKEYVAFNPNQIKSATDNNGIFSTENDDIQMAIGRENQGEEFFLTPQGEIYGFIAPNGDMYLDETVISPEHPIHEYTHLWDRTVAKNNPKLWKHGVELMKQISLWKEIEEDANYGKKWKDAGVTGNKLESLIASEVHARLVGINGEQILNNLSKQKGAEGIIGKLKQWLLDFWKDLKATFSDWSQEEIDALTLDDFNKMVVRDLVDKVNLKERQTSAQQSTINERISEATKKHQGNWSRQEAQNNPRVLYVFTDNTDRDSGSGVISADSWYSKKYGQGHHFPTMTAAVVRGLDNARPISTQRWYHQGAKGTTGRWTDANVEEFKRVIRAELQDIVDEFNTGKYNTIMFPDGDGLFNTSISNITKARTPRLYQALTDLLHEYGFDSLIPNDVKPSQNTQQPAQQQNLPGPETKINIYAGTNENADLSNFATRQFTISDSTIDNLDHLGVIGEFSAFENTGFKNVESAFQAAKMLYSEDYYKNGKFTDKGLNTLGRLIEADGSTARSIGKSITGLDTKAWDYDSSIIMKILLKESFKNNPQALQRLLSTGNATLTHTQDKSKWSTEFPRLLMEVREELRWQRQQAIQQENLKNNDYTRTEGVQAPHPADNLAATAFTFGEAPTAEQQTAAQANIDAKSAPKVKPKRPKSAAYESAISPNDSRVAQFRRTFSPQQIKDRGAYISDLFSDIIDEALQDEIDRLTTAVNNKTASEEDEQKLNSLRDPIEGRQLMVKEMGAGDIMSEIKQRITDEMGTADDTRTLLLQNTLDFFEELFNTQASLDIEEREGIRIINLKIAEKTASEEESDEQDEGDDGTGHNTASGNDGWLFEVRFENPFNSLSKKVRSMLYDVERPESEKDDLGMTRKYPMGQIYASLLSYLAKYMTSPDDFLQVDKSYEGQDNWGLDINEDNYPNGYPRFPILEKMRDSYPWIGQIIQRLTDDYLSPELNTSLRYPSTGGAMASQLYTNFRKVFIPYGKIQVGTTNNFDVTPLNYQMEDRVQYEKLQANYNNRMILSDHSIYNADGKINRDNAKWLIEQIKLKAADLARNDYQNYAEYQRLHDEDPSDSQFQGNYLEELDKFVDEVRHIMQSFGIDATRDSVVSILMQKENAAELKKMLSDLEYIATIISKVADDKVDTFNYMLDTRNPSRENQWTHFFDGRGMITDASYVQSFYDSASHKTKYSYSADNFLMERFRGCCMGTQEERQAYIDAHYGKYEWFRNQRTGEWRNKWLEFWYNYEGEQTTIPYCNIDNITEYTESKTVIRPYRKWNTKDIWLVQSRSYNPKKETAFYLAPIFSDSPMSMTVMGPRMSMNELLYGYIDDSNHAHQGAFIQLINQEMWRIQYTQRRAKEIKAGNLKPIAGFDTGGGLRFNFLPELNTFTYSDGETFLDRMLRLKNKAQTEGSDARAATLAEINAAQVEAVQTIMARRKAEYIKMCGQEAKDLTDEQYYNMTYANAAIIQLTTVDLAFYGNGKNLNKTMLDFQKRFKEVYAGGIQLNTNSKYGQKTENVILLRDDKIVSPNYEDIAHTIDGNDNLSKDEKKDIKEIFTDINVADAQAIRAMHSFRSVLDMMGRWDDRMEEALHRFENGTWTKADFDIIYQTIKPFAYSVIDRNDGFGGVIPVPQQHKNSEICALMMYAVITNNLQSPVYSALSRFMENTKDAEDNYLIDMCQFESAGKVGNQGVINISFHAGRVIKAIKDGISVNGNFYTVYAKENTSNDEAHAEDNYYAIKDQLKELLTSGKMSQKDFDKAIAELRPNEDEIIDILDKAAIVKDEYGNKTINTEIVHTMPMNNYYQQQPTPEHHIDAEASFGSQARNIAPADLPEDFTVTLKGKKGNETKKGRDAVIDFIYELLNENLIEGFFGTDKKKGLKGLFESKASLRDAVTEIVRGNPKYGRDFAEALALDENGEFVLSPNSPTIFPMMQEIITSFFKNRITKQKINGAALIQAAGIGLDSDLRLRYKNGKFLGAECYMPLTSRRFFEPLLEEEVDENGNKIMVLKPEKLKEAGLDKAIGYRIPTENKSSMMPLIIKGFTPLQNGSAIILPAEITAIAGSDFDVDKMFLMLSSFRIQEFDKAKARREFARTNAQFNSILQGLLKGGNLSEEDLEDDIDALNNEAFEEWWKEHQEEYRLDKPVIRKIEYDFSKSPKANGRLARNNMIIQIYYNILTSKAGAESVFNPQGFPDAERAAKILRILTDKNLRKKLFENNSDLLGIVPSADQIRTMFLAAIKEKYPYKYDDAVKEIRYISDEEIMERYFDVVPHTNAEEILQVLLDDTTKNLTAFIDQYTEPESPIYPQTFMHAHARNMAGKNQLGIYAIQASMAAKYQRAHTTLKEDQELKVNGKTIKKINESHGGRTVKNNGQMVGASADNGKNPTLTDMGSTEKTAPMIGYMLRAGLSHLEAALIISQPHMRQSHYSADNWKYWNGVLGKNPLNVKAGNVSTMTLMKAIALPFELTQEEDQAIAALCYRVLSQHKAQEYITRVSRADSPNGAMQNTYAKARIQIYNVDLMQAKMSRPEFPFFPIEEALSNQAVDVSASEGVVREQLKAQRMGFLHGMYALGIHSFNSLVSPYFFGAQQWFDDRIVKPILYNLNERTTDEQKEKVVDRIYKAYITYMLSSSPLFGGESTASMKEKRDYYLKSFPDDFRTILRDNADIRDLLGNILQVKSFNGRERIVLQDVGSLAKGQKADVQRRLDSLLDSDNAAARDLATDLLIYSYFDNGLGFSHDTFSHLFTTEFLIRFADYTNTLHLLDEELPEGEEEIFIRQFLNTFLDATYKVDAIIKADQHVLEGGELIKVDFAGDGGTGLFKKLVNELMSPKPQSEGSQLYPYISYNGDVYILDEEMYKAFPSTAYYHKLPKYSSYASLPLFSRNTPIEQLAEEFPIIATTSTTTTPVEEDSPYAPNPVSEDPEIDNNLADIVAGMDAFDVGDFTPDFAPSQGEQYSNEGASTLEDPLCQS